MTEFCFREEPLFFDNEQRNYKLFGVEYIPMRPRHAAYVFLPPIGTERTVADAVQANLARHLASQGVYVLRFDYYGTGDSEGEFIDITLPSLISDVDASIRRARAGRGEVSLGLFGMRFGALLAGHYAEMNPEVIDSLVLCAPVVDAHEFIKQELMQSISFQSILLKKIHLDRNKIIDALIQNKSTTVGGYDLANLDGYPLNRELYVSLQGVNLLCGPKKYQKKCLVLCVDTERRKFKPEAQKVAAAYGLSAENFLDVIENDIVWVHSKKFLLKTCHGLNTAVGAWIEKVHGKSN